MAWRPRFSAAMKILTRRFGSVATNFWRRAARGKLSGLLGRFAGRPWEPVAEPWERLSSAPWIEFGDLSENVRGVGMVRNGGSAANS
jgi:hypothetical protein